MVRHAVRLLPMLALLVAGCVDDIPDVAVSRGDVRAAIARGSLKSPRPATVALASLEGAPSEVLVRFNGQFAREAADREITLADAGTARYLVRGYLSAAPSEHGTEVSYVYDVFDADHRRVERVTDMLTLPGSGPDAWALVDDRSMASLAGRSADDLAVALAGMPEAQAGATAVAATAPQAH